MAFLETTDFMSHVWTLSTGTPRDNEPAGQKAQSLRLLSGTDGQKPALLFQADFAADVWHNFAIQVDFDNKCVPICVSSRLNRCADAHTQRAHCLLLDRTPSAEARG